MQCQKTSSRFPPKHQRGAGYIAVGSTHVTGRATAVVPSSGTADANLLPAAVETYMDELLMTLFTAERARELQLVSALPRKWFHRC